MKPIEITPQIVARFFAKVEVPAARLCWPFKGNRNEGGYGQFGIGQRDLPATHVALTIAGQPRPEGALALHHCDNPPCCNPLHLYWGTYQDNVRDRDSRGRSRAGQWQKGGKGERNNQAKLNEQQVREIRASPKGPTQLGRDYGVSTGTIIGIQKFRRWKHVKP